jgi:hypothetical protein
LHTPWFHEPIAISPKGDLRLSSTGQSVTIQDRLAVHRLLSRAVGLPSD